MQNVFHLIMKFVLHVHEGSYINMYKQFDQWKQTILSVMTMMSPPVPPSHK